MFNENSSYFMILLEESVFLIEERYWESVERIWDKNKNDKCPECKKYHGYEYDDEGVGYPRECEENKGVKKK